MIITSQIMYVISYVMSRLNIHHPGPVDNKKSWQSQIGNAGAFRGGVFVLCIGWSWSGGTLRKPIGTYVFIKSRIVTAEACTTGLPISALFGCGVEKWWVPQAIGTVIV
jgi:hypothetical protein